MPQFGSRLGRLVRSPGCKPGEMNPLSRSGDWAYDAWIRDAKGVTMRISRRAFLGGSAAALGAVGLARFSTRTATGSAYSGSGEATAEELEALDAPMILSIVDATKGEFEILVGEAAIPVTDRSLVAKLARAAREGDGHVVAS